MQHDCVTPVASRRRAGFSLIEIAVAVGLIGIMAALAAPRMDAFFAQMRVRSAARSVGDLFLLARAEAIRTGNAQIVFLSASTGAPATDPVGSSLGVDPATGGVFPAILIDDGALATANCQIDAGERREEIHGASGLFWGPAVAPVAAPNDLGAGDRSTGSSFATQGGVNVTWVMFRPDGIPVTFDAACNRGDVGSGAGAIYVSNGRRDYAVVLSALGAVKVHAFAEGSGTWTQ